MKLYATGFNAWGQLDFRSDQPGASLSEGLASLPDDVASPRCVLQADHIADVRAGLSYTMGKSSLCPAWHTRSQ